MAKKPTQEEYQRTMENFEQIGHSFGYKSVMYEIGFYKALAMFQMILLAIIGLLFFLFKLNIMCLL